MALNARCREVEQRVAALEHSVIVQPQEFESFQNLEERVAALEPAVLDLLTFAEAQSEWHDELNAVVDREREKRGAEKLHTTPLWHARISERVATLEQVTAGPPEGPGFGQLEQRVAALEQHPGNPAAHPDLCTVASHLGVLKRLQALEELCAGCKEANELIESMPLPREELD